MGLVLSGSHRVSCSFSKDRFGDSPGLSQTYDNDHVGDLFSDLRESFSFAEPLASVKRSSFSPYMEEVTRMSTPGFVAQKKAYFESLAPQCKASLQEEAHAVADPPPKEMDVSNLATVQEIFPNPPRQDINDVLQGRKPEALGCPTFTNNDSNQRGKAIDSTSCTAKTMLPCPKTPNIIIFGGSAGASSSLKKAPKLRVSPRSMTVSATFSSTWRTIQEPTNKSSKKTVVLENKSNAETFGPCGRKSSATPTTFSPFRFRTEERVAKRKEFFEELEKRAGRDAQKLQLSPNPKDKLDMFNRQSIDDALQEHKPEDLRCPTVNDDGSDKRRETIDSTSPSAETTLPCPKTPNVIVSSGSAGASESLKKTRKSGVSSDSVAVSAGRAIRESMNKLSNKTVIKENKSHAVASRACGRRSSAAPTTFSPFRFRTEERATKRKEANQQFGKHLETLPLSMSNSARA